MPKSLAERQREMRDRWMPRRGSKPPIVPDPIFVVADPFRPCAFLYFDRDGEPIHAGWGRNIGTAFRSRTIPDHEVNVIEIYPAKSVQGARRMADELRRRIE